MTDTPGSERVSVLEETFAEVGGQLSLARRWRVVSAVVLLGAAAAAGASWHHRADRVAAAPASAALLRADRLVGDAPDADALRAAWDAREALGAEAPEPSATERRRGEQHLGRLIAGVAVLDRALAEQPHHSALRARRALLGEALGWLALTCGDRALARVAAQSLSDHGADPARVDGLLSAVRRETRREAQHSAAEMERLIDEVERTAASAPGPAGPSVDELIVLGCALGAEGGAAGLVQRLAAFTVRAQRDGRRAAWSVTDRAVLRFCAVTLGRPGARRAVAPLGELLGALWDSASIVVVGRALCSTRRPEALPALMALRKRLGGNHPAWRRLAPALVAVPEPGDGAGETAAGLVRSSAARLSRGDVPGALSAATRAVSMAPDDAGALIARGRARVASGDRGGGMADFSHAVERHAARAEVWAARGQARLGLGDAVGAAADLDEALAREAAPGWRILRSFARSTLGRHTQAIEDARAALAAAPGRADAHRALGVALRGAGQLSAAVEALSTGITIDSEDPRLYLERGKTHEARADFRRANSDYNAALARDPESWDALRGRGVSMIRAGQPKAALVDLDHALRLRPGDVLTRTTRALARLRLGDNTGAKSDYERALAADPKNVEAVGGLARARLALGDVVGAIAGYTRAIELAPNDGNWLHWRARAYEARRDIAAAIADHRRAAALAPGAWEMWAHLGRALVETGDRAGARAALRKALALAPLERRGGLEKSLRQLGD